MKLKTVIFEKFDKYHREKVERDKIMKEMQKKKKKKNN